MRQVKVCFEFESGDKLKDGLLVQKRRGKGERKEKIIGGAPNEDENTKGFYTHNKKLDTL